MRAQGTIRSILLLAPVLLLACASPGPPPGGPAQPRTSSDAQQGVCMYDRAAGHPRMCLHYAFGKCMGFGDRCEPREDGKASARDPAPPPAP